MTRRHRLTLAAVSLTALLASACASTTINRILADPARYRNRDVTVSGAVVDSFGLANRGAYRIDDRTGQLWVVSTQGVPRTGARVTVKGTIRDFFDLGNLGGRIDLPPAIKSGLVMLESSHRARN